MTGLAPKTSNDLRPDMKDILPTHSSLSSAFNSQRLISKTDKKKIERIIAEKLVEGKARCYYCGVPFYGDMNPTLDHVNPKTLGGETSHKNTVLACKRCNDLKGIGNTWLLREKLVHGDAILTPEHYAHLTDIGVDLTPYFKRIDRFKFFGEKKF